MPRGTEEKGRVLLHARPLLPGEHNALTTGALCVSDDGKVSVHAHVLVHGPVPPCALSPPPWAVSAARPDPRPPCLCAPACRRQDVMVQLAPGRSKTFEVDGSLLLPSPLPADAGSPPGPSPLSAEAASLVHSLFSGINGTLLCHGERAECAERSPLSTTRPGA
jgi:hypothetical protein